MPIESIIKEKISPRSPVLKQTYLKVSVENFIDVGFDPLSLANLNSFLDGILRIPSYPISSKSPTQSSAFAARCSFSFMLLMMQNPSFPLVMLIDYSTQSYLSPYVVPSVELIKNLLFIIVISCLVQKQDHIFFCWVEIQ